MTLAQTIITIVSWTLKLLINSATRDWRAAKVKRKAQKNANDKQQTMNVNTDRKVNHESAAGKASSCMVEFIEAIEHENESRKVCHGDGEFETAMNYAAFVAEDPARAA
jgi:sortase (surface protein transpeptidase)